MNVKEHCVHLRRLEDGNGPFGGIGRQYRVSFLREEARNNIAHELLGIYDKNSCHSACLPYETTLLQSLDSIKVAPLRLWKRINADSDPAGADLCAESRF